jgi:3-oxoacyl-[acyl-carrier protein] reductase
MKCALVTGGSRGIGRAICIQLAKEGYYVLINFKNNEEEADKTLSLIKEQNGNGELLQFNVSDKEAIKATLNKWIDTNSEKHIEVLVNNAGIKDDALMSWMSDEQWDNIVKTNLNSFFYVTRIALTQMLAKKYGRIINVVSLSGLKGMAGQTNYAASKAGVIGATKSLAQEIARYNITVNAVAPGFIKTDMIEGLDEKELSKIIPAKRFGLPEEIAHAVSFFASEEASYITAQVLSINGGLYS